MILCRHTVLVIHEWALESGGQKWVAQGYYGGPGCGCLRYVRYIWPLRHGKPWLSSSWEEQLWHRACCGVGVWWRGRWRRWFGAISAGSWAPTQRINRSWATPSRATRLNQQHPASASNDGGERQGPSRRPLKSESAHGNIFGADEASIDEHRRIVAMPIILLNTTDRRPACVALLRPNTRLRPVHGNMVRRRERKIMHHM